MHVDRGELSAKFWLDPVALSRNLGFRPHELTRVQSLVDEHAAEWLEKWNGYFGDAG